MQSNREALHAVYAEMPPHLVEQHDDMLRTLKMFPELSPPGVPAPEE